MFKIARSIILSIALICLLLLPGWDTLEAAQDSASMADKAESNIAFDPSDASQRIDNEPEEGPIEEEQMSNYPDLGDAQVFPFVAGLDSY